MSDFADVVSLFWGKGGSRVVVFCCFVLFLNSCCVVCGNGSIVYMC